MNRWPLVLAPALLILYWLISPGEVRHGPGVLAPKEPEQRGLEGAATWQASGYTFRPLADFRIEARVIRREDYWLGRESELSPVDFVLSWGPMSDQRVLDGLHITQRGRWYHWQARQLPIPRREIESHSANMHMIPADREVRSLLDAVRSGDLVRIRGYLVEVQAPDGWRWRSSLSRSDTGNGSCEVVWVEDIRPVAI